TRARCSRSSRKLGSRRAMSTRSSLLIATPTTFSALSTRTGMRSSRMPDWWCQNSTNSSGCAVILRRSTTNYQRLMTEQAQKAAGPYSGRTRTIFGGEVAPGVTMVPLPGHTPGHSGYMVEGGGKRLFLWGDIVHLPTFQPARPDAGLLFDVDLPLARETRKQTFERVLADGLEVGGGHLLAPGFARVERAGTVYRIVPSE